MTIVQQVKTACKKQNRLATFMGSIIGGFIPAATFICVHMDTETNPYVLWAIVLGGLLFSAKTVFQWGKSAFNNTAKAFGFCLLIEGVMTFTHVFPLSCVALALLVCINGIATGCQIALDSQASNNVSQFKRAKDSSAKLKKVA